MIKFTANTDFNFDYAVSTLIKSSSTLTKVASAKELLKFEKTPGQTDLHVIALGAYEGTGYNRNLDGFPEKDCQENHHYFKDAGRAVHRHHKNKKSDPKYGTIKASAYNEPMKRVELIIGLDNDKCGDILAEQEKNGQTPWSMACILDPAYPVLTVNGYTPISDIKVGDVVLTHTGSWKRVTELCRSNYTGPVYQFSVNGLPEFPQVTPNHPFLTTCFPVKNNLEKQFRYFKNSEEFNDNPPAWNTADQLKVGDRFYYRRVPKFPNVAAIDDVLLAKLLGYYLAEGSINGGAVALCCNVSDSLPVEIPKLFSARYPDITVSLSPHPTSKVCLTVNIFNSELVRICDLYIGQHADKKKIALELFNASDAIKLAFLGAWLDGDGFVDNKGLHISSCNYNLILQGRDLLMTLGIPSSIYRIDHAKCATSGYENSGVEYTLNISWIDAAAFIDVSKKARDNQGILAQRDRKKPACLRETNDADLFAYRISDIEIAEVESACIYNFEVEDDHSYVLGGIISHNSKQEFDVCSFCGHKSKNGNTDRCEHIPAKLGELNDRGEICGMINPNPNWFEISHVTRPADRIGLSLKLASDQRIKPMSTADYFQLYPGFEAPEEAFYISKKASDKREILRKLAEMEKHIDAIAQGKGKNTSKDLFLKRQARLTKGKKIDDKDIDELRKHEPSKAMRGMADKGIMLGPEEFTKYLFGHRASPEIGEGVKSHCPHIFSKLDDEGATDAVNSEKFDPAALDLIPKELKNLLGKLFDGHSMLGEPSVRRVMRITIEMGPKGDDAALKPKTPPSESKEDQKLAEVYATYKIAMLNHLKEQGKLTDELLYNCLIQNR